MGFIKKGLLIILTILLIISLFFSNILLTLSFSLSYDYVKEPISSIIRESILQGSSTEDVEQSYQILKDYCQNNTEYTFDNQDNSLNVYQDLKISCEDVRNTHNVEEFFNVFVEGMVKDYYYKNYDCSFFDCFKKMDQPFFLVSEQSHDYFKQRFYFFLFISVVLIGISYFLFDNKENLLFFVGVIFIISSLPFMRLDYLVNMGGINFEIIHILSFLFTKAHTVFLINFIIGIVLLILWFALKIFIFRTKKPVIITETTKLQEIKGVLKKPVKKPIKEQTLKKKPKKRK